MNTTLKTDQSSVYVAAVVLHPSLKWKWLEKALRGRPSWISRARVGVKKLWLKYADITVTTELKTTHAGWMKTFKATALTLRTTHPLMDIRSGAKKCDDRTNLELLSSGQHHVRSRLTFASRARLETCLPSQQRQISQSASSRAPAWSELLIRLE
jgi:hypothetical protein